MAKGETVEKVVSLFFGLITKKRGHDVGTCSVSESSRGQDRVVYRVNSAFQFYQFVLCFVLFCSIINRWGVFIAHSYRPPRSPAKGHAGLSLVLRDMLRISSSHAISHASNLWA